MRARRLPRERVAIHIGHDGQIASRGSTKRVRGPGARRFDLEFAVHLGRDFFIPMDLGHRERSAHLNDRAQGRVPRDHRRDIDRQRQQGVEHGMDHARDSHDQYARVRICREPAGRPHRDLIGGEVSQVGRVDGRRREHQNPPSLIAQQTAKVRFELRLRHLVTQTVGEDRGSVEFEPSPKVSPPRRAIEAFQNLFGRRLRQPRGLDVVIDSVIDRARPGRIGPKLNAAVLDQGRGDVRIRGLTGGKYRRVDEYGA